MGINGTGFSCMIDGFCYSINRLFPFLKGVVGKPIYYPYNVAYFIDWEFNEIEGPINWEKHRYGHPRFSSWEELCWVFPRYKMGKTNNFLFDAEHHIQEIWWKGSSLTLRKVQVSMKIYILGPSRGWVLLYFSCYEELIEKLMHFPHNLEYHILGIS